MTRRASTLLALAVLLLAGCGGEEQAARQAPQTPQTSQAPEPIAAAGLQEHLEALQRIATEHGDTRAAGTAGDRRTADYIAGQLRRAGWTVRFQDVRFAFFAERGRPRLGALRQGDVDVLQYSGSGRFSGRVRPRDTPGCRAAELGRLTRRDVVLVPRGTCFFAVKARAAQRAGAGALVIVDRGADRPFSGSLGAPGIRIPVLSVGSGAGARLARTSGTVPVDVRTTSERRTTRNVLAETPRTGQGRVVMAGGHLDSVPAGPGINDNASGVAALLELAERLADEPGLRLGFWGAEELGLHGSRRYVASLDRAGRRRLAAYVNLDMVGSRDAATKVYDTDDRVERTLRDAFEGDEDEQDLGAASDHAPFAHAGVPVGGFYAGRDRCYHRACDTLRNVDLGVLTRIARATERALARLRDR